MLGADKWGELTAAEVIEWFAPDIVWAFNCPSRLLHRCKPRRRYKLITYRLFNGVPVLSAGGQNQREDGRINASHADVRRFAGPGGWLRH